MEIQINNYPVDFKINSEETISEVINSITDWTMQRDLVFTEAEINEMNYSIDNLPEISLSEIKTLNCLVTSKAEAVTKSLNAAIDYCKKVQNYLNIQLNEDKFNATEIENIVSGIDWITEVLNKASQIIMIDYSKLLYKDKPVTEYIDQLISFKSIASHRNDKKALYEFINNHRYIFSVLTGILNMLLISDDLKALMLQSTDSPDVIIRSLLDIRNETQVQAENLEEIAAAYQSGKDDVASEKLNNFIDFVFNYSRICYQVTPVFGINLHDILIKKTSLHGINENIQDLLKSIIDAMENNDMVTLSDILEYELKPVFMNLEKYIDLLLDSLSNHVTN